MTKLRVMLIPVVCLLLQAPGSSAFAALEKSSKKECALCHVMWLDVFRTDRQTLIQWQPGNVLMKNTQGIVSSEEVCYSCHDGYVADARFNVWDHNNHPVFKKPSKEIRMPAALTLSNKSELYCGTCHSPHSGREAAPGASPEDTIPGPLSFLKLPNVDSSLCEDCHVTDVDARGTNHPVHTDKLAIPETLFARGSVKATRKNAVICQTCHMVHGARGQQITVMDNRQSALCMACHREGTITGTLHDARRSMPTETNRLGQPVSVSGPCGACHVPHRAEGYKLWARKRPSANPASGICLSCHGATADRALGWYPPENTPQPITGAAGRTGNRPKEKSQRIKGIGLYSHPVDVKMISKIQGQAAPAPQSRMPLFSPDGFQAPDGTVQCFSCHGIHQWNPDNPEDRGAKEIPANAANSFLHIAASGDSALCVACHTDKAQLLSFDHDLRRTAPRAKNIRGETALVSGPCGACHVPHNATDRQLWARAGGAAVTPAGIMPQYCTGCHGPNGVAEKKQVGQNDHPVDVVSKGRHIPPPARVDPLLPLYNTTGERPGGDRILCRTCHDPHIWSATGGGSAPAGVPAGSTGKEAENVEGDARNSFLRQTASPAPDLCVVCHEDTAMLVGTDHDFSITAPSVKNRLNQNLAQAGPCGVCHAVHNSPPGPLLWALPYGPVAENQHPMNALCTGCHSKGGVAQDKSPPVASHPKGMLIDNILTFRKGATGYIKLFNDDFKEVEVGNLSCTSCHAFDQWDHRARRPGPGIKIEGNADTSFLRASSDQTVCIDCHGDTAIWRYIYFHSFQKRAMLKDVWP